MPNLSNTDFLFLAALLLGLALFLYLRSRTRTTPLTQIQIQDLKRRGAIVLDVRTPGEFSQGHAKGARNLPLDALKEKMGKLDKTKPYLTCCASGSRSASARSILLKAGFQEVHNVGAWTTLKG